MSAQETEDQETSDSARCSASCFHWDLLPILPFWILEIVLMLLALETIRDDPGSSTWMLFFLPSLLPLLTLLSVFVEILVYFQLPPSRLLAITFPSTYLASNVIKCIPWSIICFSAIWQDQTYGSGVFLHGLATFTFSIVLIVFYLPLTHSIIVWYTATRSVQLGDESLG